MSRRRAAPADSLELLLDTICNTFGGIVFIALLVVILLQMSGDDVEQSRRDGETVSAAELEQLQSDWEAAQADLARVLDLRRSQDGTLAALAPPELETLVAERDAAATRTAELREQRNAILMTSTATAKEIQSGEEELADLESELAVARTQVAELEDTLRADRDARRQDLRMPMLRAGGFRGSLALVVQYGRLYVWHKYDRFGNRVGLNTDEFIILEEDELGARTTPRPTRGTPLDASAESALAIGRRLSGFSPDQFDAEIVVRPDSFAEFAILRNALVSAGFEYRLLPADDGSPIVDRGGNESRVQ